MTQRTVTLDPARLHGLTDRDRALLSALHHHRVLTTPQVAKMFFGALDTARHRLILLHRRDLLTRWRASVWPGSQSWRYALSTGGAQVHAAITGAPLPRPAKHAEHLMRLAASPHTTHLLGVNDVFADLTWHGRTHPGTALRQWWPDTIAADACAGIVRPDGYGEWTDTTGIGTDHPASLGHATRAEHSGLRGVTVQFFLEYDRGTETHATLTGKLDKYTALAATGIHHPVLIVFTSPAREANFHRTHQHRHQNGGGRFLVATTARPPRDYRDESEVMLGRVPIAADPVWAILRRPGRYRLADLPARPDLSARPDRTRSTPNPVSHRRADR